MKWIGKKKEKGDRAEQLAADYLSGQGFRIVERNFRCKLGEIDLIARDGEDLVFVEVRSRFSRNSPNPAYSVDYRKQKKIAQVAELYLVKKFRRMPPARFDVVLVTLDDSTIEHIPNAFSVADSDFYM